MAGNEGWGSKQINSSAFQKYGYDIAQPLVQAFQIAYYWLHRNHIINSESWM